MNKKAEFEPPPGFTREEFEKLLEDHIGNAMFEGIVSYLKATADSIDEHGLQWMTAEDLRRIALEMTFAGYKPQ
jgi:hypothetical protein